MKRNLPRAPAIKMLATLALVVMPGCWNSSNSSDNPDTPGAPLGIPTGTTTDVDGNVYHTIRLGGQEWMVENLKVTHYNDGSAISLVEDATPWTKTLSPPAYCWYDNDPSNKDIYGALYNWYAVQTSKLCPTGWIVPSSSDWAALFTYLGGELVAGGKLKEAGTDHWQSPNTGATNESGFTALPGGQRDLAGGFAEIGQTTLWWCSNTDLFELEAASYCAYADYDRTNSSTSTSYQSPGYSVRCMRTAQ